MTAVFGELEKEAKARLRAEAFARRAAVVDREAAALAAAGHFIAGVWLDRSRTVALYWPIRDEIDCRSLVSRLVENGHRVCLPAVMGADVPLEMRLWEKDEALHASGFGTLAPAEGAPVVVPDIIVLPLLAFDRHGTRLGYGKGHYDRTIAGLPKTPLLVGYGFSAQEFDLLPRESHDRALDMVVTEAGVRRFEAA